MNSVDCSGLSSSFAEAWFRVMDRLEEREADLKQFHRQSEDFDKQLDLPFEHEKKLSVATARHQEIVTALDIGVLSTVPLACDVLPKAKHA
jgi:hypothetical protein